MAIKRQADLGTLILKELGFLHLLGEKPVMVMASADFTRNGTKT
jgi:hypothetical protein